MKLEITASHDYRGLILSDNWILYYIKVKFLRPIFPFPLNTSVINI